MTISIDPRPGRSPLVVVHATNIARIDARLDIPTADGIEQRWFASRHVRHGRVEFDPDEILDPGTRGSISLHASGHDRDTLVARRQETIELG